MNCLDNDIIMALLFGEVQARAHVERLGDATPFCTTAINVFELLHKTKNMHPDNALKIRKMIGELEVLPLDASSAALATHISFQLSKKGLVVDPTDIFIGAIALQNNCTLHTRNVRHLSRIEGLRLQSW